MISTDELLRLTLRARDGDFGGVTDLIFHDRDWTVRELIVETGGWLFGRRVSLDPDEVLQPDLVNGVLEVELTREQVKNGPAGVARSPADEPVSDDVLAWNGSNSLAAVQENVLFGGVTAPAQPLFTETPPPPSLHLRSLSEFHDYTVLAGDEPVGQLAGFLIDTIAWDLPMALVKLDWPDAPTVLLPARMIADLGWPEHVVTTHLDASVLRNAPTYDARVLDERVYMPAVADYYWSQV